MESEKKPKRDREDVDLGHQTEAATENTDPIPDLKIRVLKKADIPEAVHGDGHLRVRRKLLRDDERDH